MSLVESKIQVLIYGFYNHNNLGDELFKIAFAKLFPQFNFYFTDYLSLELISKFNIIFFGGGSFLDQNINMEKGLFDLLMNKQIFYIGIGAETDISEEHYKLLSIADGIWIRNERYLDKIKLINKNTYYCPDIVYYIDEEKTNTKNNKNILFLPNALLIPDYSEPVWKYTAWEYFKSEISQYIDEKIQDGYVVDIYAMCQDNKINDLYAGVEIINKSKNKNINLIDAKRTYDDVKEFFQQYSYIITQRYHGIVLAKIFGIPHCSIYHHDKLKENSTNSIPYYAFNKNKINYKISNLTIKRNYFIELQNIVGEKIDEQVCRN